MPPPPPAPPADVPILVAEAKAPEVAAAGTGPGKPTQDWQYAASDWPPGTAFGRSFIWNPVVSPVLSVADRFGRVGRLAAPERAPFCWR